MVKKEAAVETAEQQAAHSSAEYADALNAFADIFEIVIDFVPGAKAFKAVDAAQKALPFVRRAAAAMPDLAPVVDPLIEQAPEAVRAAGDAAAAAGDAVAGAANNAAHAVADPVKANLAARQAAKDRREARKAIIGHASTSIPLAKFDEQRAAHVALVSGGKFPGCYAIVRAGKGFLHDLSDFQGVYVGAADDMWVAVAEELAGNGNPDVYADAKYDAGVHILMYPCPEEQLDVLRQALIVALDADVSYNARELDVDRAGQGGAARA